MMRLYDCASVIRSKNAGPLTLTIDLLFENKERFDRVLASPAFTAEVIAELYGVEESSVRIHPFVQALAVKVSLPRPGASSGAPGDRDCYGSQQHFPFADMDLW